jgi:hypothetical protein
VRTNQNRSVKDLLILPIPPVELFPQTVATADGDETRLQIVGNLSRQYNMELIERVQRLRDKSVRTWDVEGLRVSLPTIV